MATVNSVQYAAGYVTVPSAKLPIGDYNGRVRSAFANYTLLADATSGDILKLFKIPAGARVINWKIKCADLGGTGTMNFGWAASADAVEAASASGFNSALDVSGQASLGIPVAGIAGMHKKFASEVDAQLALPTTSGATAALISVQLDYVIE